MKNCIIRHWCCIFVFLSGLCMVILGIGDFTLRVRMILSSTAVIFLHFFEEFAFPGIFPAMGVAVELKITDPDPHHWPLNEINAMSGNWYYAVVVCLLPLALPEVPFLTLSVALFALVETFGHLVVFPIATGHFYNPGLFTALFGLLPISVVCLVRTAGTYTVLDVVPALLWIVLNYWIAFRPPIYKRLGKRNDRYAFTEEEAGRGARYRKNEV